MLMIRPFGWGVLTFLILLGAQFVLGWEKGTALAWAFLAMFFLIPLNSVLNDQIRALTVWLGALTSQQPYRQQRPPTLVIRGIDDEAALTLGLGAILGRLTLLSASTMLYVFIIFRWVFLGGGILALAVSLVSSYAGDLLLGAVATFFFGWLAGKVPTLIFCMGVATLARGAAPAVFGHELLLTYLDILVKSDSVPDGSGDIRVVTLPPAISLLPSMRHSLHGHPSVVMCIADWMLPAGIEVSAAGSNPAQSSAK